MTDFVNISQMSAISQDEVFYLIEDNIFLRLEKEMNSFDNL